MKVPAGSKVKPQKGGVPAAADTISDPGLLVEITPW